MRIDSVLVPRALFLPSGRKASPSHTIHPWGSHPPTPSDKPPPFLYVLTAVSRRAYSSISWSEFLPLFSPALSPCSYIHCAWSHTEVLQPPPPKLLCAAWLDERIFRHPQPLELHFLSDIVTDVKSSVSPTHPPACFEPTSSYGPWYFSNS